MPAAFATGQSSASHCRGAQRRHSTRRTRSCSDAATDDHAEGTRRSKLRESESDLRCHAPNGWERPAKPQLRKPPTFRRRMPAAVVRDAAVRAAAERLKAKPDASTRAISFRRRGLCRSKIASPGEWRCPVPGELKPVRLIEGSTVKEFAEKLGIKPKDVVTLLLQRGVFATINQPLNRRRRRRISANASVTTLPSCRLKRWWRKKSLKN